MARMIGVRRVVEEEGDNGGTDEHENDRARKLREEEGHASVRFWVPAGGRRNASS